MKEKTISKKELYNKIYSKITAYIPPSNINEDIKHLISKKALEGSQLPRYKVNINKYFDEIIKDALKISKQVNKQRRKDLYHKWLYSND